MLTPGTIVLLHRACRTAFVEVSGRWRDVYQGYDLAFAKTVDNVRVFRGSEVQAVKSEYLKGWQCVLPGVL